MISKPIEVKNKLLLSVSALNQQSGGYVKGEDSYKNKEAIFGNEDPDAFRKTFSLRGQIHMDWAINPHHHLDMVVWSRLNRMDFLMHFLRGTPIEKNAHHSFGARPVWRHLIGDWEINNGIEIEYSQGQLSETQNAQTMDGFGGGQDAIDEFPQGVHYDYRINVINLATFTQNIWHIHAKTDIHLGLRLEYSRYDYDNLLDGEGQNEIFGRFYRPPDRIDDYFTATPKIGLYHRFNDLANIFTNYVMGTRAPQTSDLYRLHRKQQGQIGAIKAERLDSLELGLRGGINPSAQWEIVGFYMDKRHHHFRNPDFETIINGKTRHLGVELNLDALLSLIR